jgi:tRNA (guanosine-2'-O-)-methyltransferase
MHPERTAKLRAVAEKRQPNLTVILENVHDLWNVGAVLRSCDSVGIGEVFLLYTEAQEMKDKMKLGKKTSSGARRWVDVHYYTNAEACFRHVRSKYDHIYSTHLGESAVDVYDLDLTQSVALIFGNEDKGISPICLAHSDGNFMIPQMGFIQSLNISVACAVTLYEAYRQRNAKGFYGDNNPATPQFKEELYQSFYTRSITHDRRTETTRIDV